MLFHSLSLRRALGLINISMAFFLARRGERASARWNLLFLGICVTGLC